MLRDFTYPAKAYHRMYLRDAENRARRDAVVHEAKQRRIRSAMGNRLIAIGERLVDPSGLEALDTAA